MRHAVLATVGSLLFLALLLAWIVPGLPDPVATHFGLDGTADGYSSSGTVLAIGLGIPAAAAGLLVTMTWSRRRPPEGLRWILGIPVGVVWGLGSLLIGMLLPQRGLADAANAAIPGWVVAGAAVIGVAATFIASRLVEPAETSTATAAAPSHLERAEFPDPGTALWRGETPTGLVVIALGVAIAMGAVVAGLLIDWWFAVIMLALAVLPVAAMRFTVTIGPATIRVAGLLAGWPRLVIGMGTVTAAESSWLSPVELLKLGGYGIRIKPGLSTTAVATRSGPALQLSRTDGSTVVITLDRPDEAAAVINTLLDRRADANGPELAGRIDPPGSTGDGAA